MRLLRSYLDQLWLGTVCFILFTTLIAMALSLPGLAREPAWVAIWLGAVLTGFTLWQVRFSARTNSQSPRDHWLWSGAIWICFLLFTLRTFLWLIFSKEGQIAVLARNNLGDLPLHIQYIRFFSQGAPLWPVNPIHAHSSIGYPFGIDYFNAVLDVCGIPLWNALIVTGLLCSLVTGIALQRWGRAFGMAGFLFNGGAAGLAFFTTGKWMDYQQAVNWKLIPLSLFVTQRGFLYALPTGLLLLWQWRRFHSSALVSGGLPARRLPFWLEWLIYATMPLFHLHTFLFLSVMLGALALFGADRTRLRWLGLASVPPAGAWIYLITDKFHAAGNLGWLPGWMQGTHFDAVYWLRNFGALPFFVGWLLVVLVRQKARGPVPARQSAREALLFVVPATALFVVTLFIKFSPWEWDNTKLMMWSYLVILPFIWEWLREKTHLVVQGTACFLLFASGFISLFGGLGPKENGYDIASESDVLSVSRELRDVPILETFAAAPGFAHPLVFAGRRLALAYHGHMVGHGLPYQEEKLAMDRLMNGADDWEKAAAFLGVHYIFWGTEEEKTWPASEKPWLTSAELFATDSWGEIYKLP